MSTIAEMRTAVRGVTIRFEPGRRRFAVVHDGVELSVHDTLAAAVAWIRDRRHAET